MSVLSEERLSFKEVTFRLIFGECLKAKDSGKWLVGEGVVESDMVQKGRELHWSGFIY